MKLTYTLFFLILSFLSFTQTPYMAALDGQDNYILVGDVNDLGTSNFTIEAWFYANATETDGGKIINKGLTTVGTPSNAGYSLRFGYTAGDEIDFSFGGTSGSFISLIATGIQTDQWYHVAGTRKGNTYKLYVNCQLEDSITTTNTLNLDTNIPLAIGAIDKGGLSFNSTFLDGYIDEVRIWTTSKDSSQICDLKDCTVDMPTNNLLAVYNMDHTSGTVAIDNSGNGNDGSCIDGATWAPSSHATACYTSGIEETPQNNESGITLYPNPANNVLNFKNLDSIYEYEIYDISGKIISQGVLNFPSLTIAHLTEGIYMIALKTAENRQFLKFIVD